jgi:hypothetical protein
VCGRGVGGGGRGRGGGVVGVGGGVGGGGLLKHTKRCVCVWGGGGE